MPARAHAGTCLAKLVRMALPLCRAAQSQCPRMGPGRPPEFDDWKIAVLIIAAVLKGRKTKSAQYRFLHEHRGKFKRWLGLKRFPARSTYFQRYTQAQRLLPTAIEVQGRQALTEGITTAQAVAVDKSLLPARGQPWEGRRRGRPAGPGMDRQADWGYSPSRQWVYGYSYEVLTTADPGTVHFPLLASADVASASEYVSCRSKLQRLPTPCRFVLADSGYDGNALGEPVEWNPRGIRTGRRFVCPPNRRTGRGRPRRPRTWLKERRTQDRRWQRIDFYHSPRGQRLYAQRCRSVEPLHDRLKAPFELSVRVWHRGLGNNQTQLLAAIFCYQLLVRFNFRCGHRNAQVRWILECL